MIIDKETVEKVANLARLELAEDEKEAMIKDMSKILDFMAKLNEIDTSGVEPLVYMTNEVNVLREDVVKQTITTEEGLKNAPKHNEDYFLVAKVIDK
ncbi:aspartyl/glutamyl-tRNA(Asn/Gln) amidotransferase subunit C [Mucilaginibacter mallensis]|uniref:Aspartyl/glutamyl-tRNA(Asn/Gln) amidotransferase subunit C n=1 Tax=Mucilaginibacter mallensis TaxID=652787 RepID=A0A1H1Z004_MUCMA|nr:Asp-tRNA(Asn)/Glu-tRNA(Gln) amidotransferase subunit GatC [Mucilaginibacter mallensis]SDT27010.1 aspartyl/glutamyl-tRNA(Asn/Gln) amidotransferase subunit C [Mucilaginibacter mallensis]